MTEEEEELLRQHREFWKHPEKWLAHAEECVRKNPSDSQAYFARCQAWERLGRLDLALQDLNTSIALEPKEVSFMSRGEILRDLGRYEEALEDFQRSEAMDGENWKNNFGPLLRADCYARLGNETAAMASLSDLRDDYWTPGFLGFPAGGKSAMAEEIHRRANAAKQKVKR
jgi:tetratricopeptide (TPR) repeat protein